MQDDDVFQALLANVKSEAKRLYVRLMLKQMKFLLDQPPNKTSYAVLQIPSGIPTTPCNTET